METLDYIRHQILPVAYRLLPPTLETAEATALLLTIGLQESVFQYRKQIGGPARGWWQFEAGGGCTEVLTHPACKGHLAKVLETLRYPLGLAPGALHAALEHNDVLAAVCARLLLRTLPEALPRLSQDPEVGWSQYLRTWRPGKPHRETWNAYTRQAQAVTFRDEYGDTGVIQPATDVSGHPIGDE